MFWQMKAVSKTSVLQVTVRPSRSIATSLIFLLLGFASVIPEKGGTKLYSGGKISRDIQLQITENKVHVWFFAMLS